MSVGENIRNRREALGLSQVQVAAEAGISQAMLCQIERGTKNPSLQVSLDIARILKCNVEELARDDGRKESRSRDGSGGEKYWKTEK